MKNAFEKISRSIKNSKESMIFWIIGKVGTGKTYFLEKQYKKSKIKLGKIIKINSFLIKKEKDNFFSELFHEYVKPNRNLFFLLKINIQNNFYKAFIFIISLLGLIFTGISVENKEIWNIWNISFLFFSFTLILSLCLFDFRKDYKNVRNYPKKDFYFFQEKNLLFLMILIK